MSSKTLRPHLRRYTTLTLPSLTMTQHPSSTFPHTHVLSQPPASTETHPALRKVSATHLLPLTHVTILFPTAEQHINQHVDDKVSVSYSTSSKGTHHQEKQTLVVEPGKEVVHHSTIVSNEPATPQEHRHHHSHHRNHDVHEGIVRVPLPAVVVPHVEPALHSSPLVVHEKSSTHRLSKTFTQAAPVKTVEHHEIKVHEPVKTIQHHEIKVHEPIKTVQHHQVKVQETVKSLHAPVKQSLVQPIAKSYLSPSELFRTRSDHQDRVVVTHSSDGKERYIPNYKPSSPYSRCYCV